MNHKIVIVNKNLLGTSIKKGDICIVIREVSGTAKDACFVKSCESGVESIFVFNDLEFIC